MTSVGTGALSDFRRGCISRCCLNPQTYKHHAPPYAWTGLQLVNSLCTAAGCQSEVLTGDVTSVGTGGGGGSSSRADGERPPACLPPLSRREEPARSADRFRCEPARSADSCRCDPPSRKDPRELRCAGWGLGSGVWGVEFGVWGSGVWGLGFGVWGSGVWGLGFGVLGSGYNVLGDQETQTAGLLVQ